MEEYDLLQCVDKGLDPFGSNVKQSIYWKMSILHNYSRNEIIENPDLLQKVIRETLNDNAISVEESITRQIRIEFGLAEESARNLKDAITNAKRQIIIVRQPASFLERQLSSESSLFSSKTEINFDPPFQNGTVNFWVRTKGSPVHPGIQIES